jgi:hypothetical protein
LHQRSLHSRVVLLGIETHARKWLERVIREDVNASMICFQVIDLLAEKQGPEVFAEEFDGVEGGGWTGCVAGESVGSIIVSYIFAFLFSCLND